MTALLATLAGAPAVLTARPAGADPGGTEPAGVNSWPVDLGTAVGAAGAVNVAGTGDGVTIAPGQGYAIGYPAASALPDPAGSFAVQVDADTPAGAKVRVDLRGARVAGSRGGGWGEWMPTPAALPRAADEVQVRLMLTAAPDGEAPVVHRLTITAGALSAARPDAPAQAPSLHLYATREGLTGHTTANGHVITSRDHFVSLPSWRALSPQGFGDYSVRVCAPLTGRCAYEPVWDVGPWNTADDYWNLDRERWDDLPAGIPESQAAVQGGYHGGRDEFGRTVRNPAGIDLADGTMRDDLGLPGGGALVTVSYLWAGAGTQATVRTDGEQLHVRSGPSARRALVGVAVAGARLPVECQTAGQGITGYLGSTNVWARVGPDNYVSRAYLDLDPGVTVPSC